MLQKFIISRALRPKPRQTIFSQRREVHRPGIFGVVAGFLQTRKDNRRQQATLSYGARREPDEERARRRLGAEFAAEMNPFNIALQEAQEILNSRKYASLNPNLSQQHRMLISELRLIFFQAMRERGIYNLQGFRNYLLMWLQRARENEELAQRAPILMRAFMQQQQTMGRRANPEATVDWLVREWFEKRFDRNEYGQLHAVMQKMRDIASGGNPNE